jgi:hypothetical protein
VRSLVHRPRGAVSRFDRAKTTHPLHCSRFERQKRVRSVPSKARSIFLAGKRKRASNPALDPRALEDDSRSCGFRWVASQHAVIARGRPVAHQPHSIPGRHHGFARFIVALRACGVNERLADRRAMRQQLDLKWHIHAADKASQPSAILPPRGELQGRQNGEHWKPCWRPPAALRSTSRLYGVDRWARP